MKKSNYVKKDLVASRIVPDGPPIDFSNKNLKGVEEIGLLKVKAFETAVVKADKGASGGLGGFRGSVDDREGTYQVI